jgi:6-pyruvoyltetrahydropterin/6-carboxytetrahydropterin synthase
LTVEVQGFVSQFQGPKAGMLVDYGELKQYVQPIVDEYLDHHFLNETLGITSPTSELVAMWVFEVILTALPPRRDRGYRLKAVEIDETCTSSCRFEGVDE